MSKLQSEGAEKKGFDRNFYWNIAEAAFVTGGFTFFSLGWYVTSWLTKFGVGPAKMGLLFTCWSLAVALPGPFSAARARPLTRIKPYLLTWLGAQRLAILSLVVGILVIGTEHGDAMIALTFTSVIVLALALGMASPIGLHWIGKTTPPDQRGRLQGVRSSVGGMVGIGANAFAAWCFSRLLFPLNYEVMFGLAFVLLMGSWTCFVIMRERPHDPPPPPPPGDRLWSKIWRTMTKDQAFSRLLVAIVVVHLAILMAAGFFPKYGLDSGIVTEAQLSGVAIAGSIGIMVWSPFLGWLGDRLGNRWLLAVSAVFGALAACCGWCTPWGLPWQYAASVFCGGSGISASIGVGNLILEYAPSGEEAHYSSVAVPLISATGMLSPMVGGVLAEWLGFPFLMGASTILCAVAAVGVWFLVRSRPAAPSPEPKMTGAS